MTSKANEDASRRPESPQSLPTFEPGAKKFGGKPLDFDSLTPQAEAEPDIERGLDLSGKTKIVFAAGRGKTGKTTLLRWFAEMSAERNGTVILADIDPTNRSFSKYFSKVYTPESDNPAIVGQWLQKLIEFSIVQKVSLIVDLGGGDTTLRTLATEMPGLTTEIEAAGLVPVMLYMLGTQVEDLTPALTLHARGFKAKAQALILNEVAIDPGSTRTEAFERITGLMAFSELRKASTTVWMPRLFAAEAIEARACRFLAAAAGKVDPPLGFFDAARLKAWLETMNRRFAGISSWIP